MYNNIWADDVRRKQTIKVRVKLTDNKQCTSEGVTVMGLWVEV
jgi:hypothetical protein